MIQTERSAPVIQATEVRSIEQVLKDENSGSLLRKLNVVTKRAWEIGQSLKNLYEHTEKNNSSHIRAKAKHEFLLQEAANMAKSLEWELRIQGTIVTYDKNIFYPRSYRPRKMNKITTKRYDKPTKNALKPNTVSMEKAVQMMNEMGFKHNRGHLRKLVENGDIRGNLAKDRLSISSLEAWMGTHVPKGGTFITGW